MNRSTTEIALIRLRVLWGNCKAIRVMALLVEGYSTDTERHPSLISVPEYHSPHQGKHVSKGALREVAQEGQIAIVVPLHLTITDRIDT